ncbi:hypothetical protein VTN77DRAFT_6018 [Rasamsonia byssochlamydoides]|uniref:uncharacterized protein n=1 Tax=Rasamsonia byssochlamydoides TaxID=89139 RepID=UPI0037444092
MSEHYHLALPSESRVLAASSFSGRLAVTNDLIAGTIGIALDTPLISVSGIRALDRYLAIIWAVHLLFSGTASSRDQRIPNNISTKRGVPQPDSWTIGDAERSARTLRDRFAFHRVPQPNFVPYCILSSDIASSSISDCDIAADPTQLPQMRNIQA